MKRYSFSPLSQMTKQSPYEVTIKTLVGREEGENGDYVLATDYSAALAVLRGCVEAMGKAEPSVVWGGGVDRPTLDAYEAALAAARKLLEGEADKTGDEVRVPRGQEISEAGGHTGTSSPGVVTGSVGTVLEREAVERERKAFVAGWWANVGGSDVEGEAEVDCDRRYPAPKATL